MSNTMTAYIAIGSNIDPGKHLPEAIAAIANEVAINAISTVYASKALNRPGQPDYRNAVIAIETDLHPDELRDTILKPIESKLGRVRTPDKYEARNIDLDLILYADAIVTETDMRLPDPDIYERPFVAVPLLELAPDLVLPDTHTPLAQVPAATTREGLTIDHALTNDLKGTLKS